MEKLDRQYICIKVMKIKLLMCLKVLKKLCKDIEQLFRIKKIDKKNILKLNFIINLSQKSIIVYHYLNHK